MRSAVIVFPGSNCDRDMARAFERASGRAPSMVWHKETELPADVDLVGLPGGFSFGDYLRCGAIAARAPIMAAVARHVRRGGLALGVCNGWQTLIEAGLLPGALLRNASLSFVCRDVSLRVERADSPFTANYAAGARIRLPVAHHDGAFFASEDALAELEAEGRVAFRYDGAPRDAALEHAARRSPNPNGSRNDIAGVFSADLRVLGMMPHPERAIDAAHGGVDGAPLFAALAASVSTPADLSQTARRPESAN